MWHRTLAASLLLVAAVGPARAVPPEFHGCLLLRPAAGPFNRQDGNSTLTATNWQWDLSPISSGIAPATEQITISLGGDQNTFLVPLGAVKPKRHGTLFVYRGPRDQPRGVTSLKMKMLTPMRYKVSFGLKGIDLSQLVFQSDACLPVAIVVGLDDGFTGAQLVRPGGLNALQSRRVLLTGACAVDTSQWAWLSGSGSSSAGGGSSPCPPR